MLKLGYNTTETGIVVDDGHVIGGRSWGPYDSTGPEARREVAAGRLIEADRNAVAASPREDAAAAIAAYDARAAAYEAELEADAPPAVDPIEDAVGDTDEGGDATVKEPVEEPVAPEKPAAKKSARNQSAKPRSGNQ